MSDFLGNLIGSAAGAASPLGMVGTVAKAFDDVYTSIFPSPEAKATAEAIATKAKMDAALAQAQLELQPILAQLGVNKAEAANPSMFVAGWRPAVGWICASGLAEQFMVAPLVTFLAGLAGYHIAFPSLDMGTLMALLTGMLGIGGLRTFEKVQGVVSTAVGKAK